MLYLRTFPLTEPASDIDTQFMQECSTTTIRYYVTSHPVEPEMMHQSSSNRHHESDRNKIPADFCRENSGPRIHRRIELPPPPSSVSSLTWRERFEKEKDPSDKENGVTHAKKKSLGLGAVVKLLKEASYEKKVFAGERKPLGDASNGRMLLQSRAASKRELEKVQSKLSELC